MCLEEIWTKRKSLSGATCILMARLKMEGLGQGMGKVWVQEFSKLPIMSGRNALSYGEGNGTPLQYSCLENPMEEPGRQQSTGSRRVGHD